MATAVKIIKNNRLSFMKGTQLLVWVAERFGTEGGADRPRVASDAGGTGSYPPEAQG